ncbi:MAG: beta-ketoacyl reductase [Myxococcota bacterium]
MARWLAAHGAAEIVLLSRRGEADVSGIAGARVVAADVTDADAVSALFAAHPPDGVVHAAGITAPQGIDALEPATVAETLRAKADGARVLDRVLGDRAVRFAVVSSIAAVWGSRDLAAYAAANAVAAGIAHRRGGVAVAFGPWGGGGMVDAERAAALGRAGLRPLDPAAAAEALGRALTAGEPELVVAAADWARLVPALELGRPDPLFDAVRPAAAPVAPAVADDGWPARLAALPDVAAREAAVVPHLTQRAREVLRLDPGRALPEDQLLADLGFDSLMATELKATLLADGLDVPLGRLLGGPSVAELANMVVARLPDAPAALEAAEEGPDGLLLWTHLAAVIVGIGLASAVWLLVT